MTRSSISFSAKAKSITPVLVALVLVSACQKEPVYTQDQLKRQQEVRQFLETQSYSEPKVEKAEKVKETKREREFKEFKEQLTIDTNAYAELSVETAIAVNAIRQKGIDCNAPKWTEATDFVDQVEGLADTRWELNQLQSPFYRSSAVRKVNMHWYDEFNALAIKTRFHLADIALEKKCLDMSDGHYRHIVKRYTGNAYSAYRDRARIGIDDVRVKRKQ